MILLSESVNVGRDISSEFLIYFNGVYLPERRVFGIRDTSPVSSYTAVLAAGADVSTSSAGDSPITITIDRSNQLKFTCSRR